jgi:hypothetical protein
MDKNKIKNKIICLLKNDFIYSDEGKKYYYLDGKYYDLNDIMKKCINKYGYSFPSYGRLSREDIVSLLSQKNNGIGYNANNQININNLSKNQKKTYINKLNNLKQKLINEKKNLNFNNKELENDRQNLINRHNKAINIINDNFQKLDYNFQIINELYKNKLLFDNEQEYIKQNEFLEERQKK